MQEEAGFLYWIWDGRDVQSVWDKSELSVFFVVFFLPFWMAILNAVLMNE